jgi:hypothetical protein
VLDVIQVLDRDDGFRGGCESDVRGSHHPGNV